MKDFLEVLIKHLVDKPDEVVVNEIKGDTTIIYELEVGDGDMGKVIGKHGQTARSLRTLLSAVSAKNGQRSFLEIIDKHATGKRDHKYNPQMDTKEQKPDS